MFDDFFAIRKEARNRREAKVAARQPSRSEDAGADDNAAAGTTESADALAAGKEGVAVAAGGNHQAGDSNAAPAAAASATTDTADGGEGEGKGEGKGEGEGKDAPAERGGGGGGGFWNGSKEGGMVGEKNEELDWSDIEDVHLRLCLEMGMTLFKDFASVPSNINSKIRKTLFPPTDEENEWMHLGEFVFTF